MDWFTWLSKTGLESSLVYEYGLEFTNNELEKEDIAYFNHEFLQSMGISIAKHRLEILKLATNHKSYGLRHPIAKLFLVLKKTKKSLTSYISTMVHHKYYNRALVLVPNRTTKTENSNKLKINKGGAISYSSRWKRAKMMRNSKKLTVNNDNNQERLMITNGDNHVSDNRLVASTPKLDSFSSHLVYELQESKEESVPNHDDNDHHEDGQYWCLALEEPRWDAMFQDLKPT